MVQILITVKSRKHNTKGLGHSTNVVVDVDDKGTIEDVAQALSAKLDISRSRVTLIFCGSKLSDDTPVNFLLLGPQTSLTAIVAELYATEDVGKNEIMPVSSSASSSTSIIASFQVFCKGCDSLKRAKLRVYCSECSSSSVLVTKNPSCWDDVLQSNAIQVDCRECEKESSARFCFKCTDCGQIAIPLMHIRGSQEGQGPCGICCDPEMKIVVRLNCHHQTCVDCFTTYIKRAFTENKFTFYPPNGYTVGCPEYGCRGCVVDTHCFYLLGKLNYYEYQRQAAERFVFLEEEGIFCPRADCGAAFLREFDPSNSQAICPECHVSFCGLCRRQDCNCSELDATEETIKRTCRKCPQCNIPTERDGGCAHMHCIRCGTEWCFLCVKPWSEACQWDHWFD